MSEIKAIETYYNGYKFRSRLEARWAVFFDAMHIQYEYEPEGFILSNGQAYLPDFYLPLLDIYVEVKPTSCNFISHPNNEEVSFGDKEKYGFFMHDMTSEGHGVWFVFGDPVDALLSEEHGGHGSNELFGNCGCTVKEFHEEPTTCNCNGEVIRPSECNKSRLVSGRLLAFAKDFAIWDISIIFFPKIKALSFSWMIDTDEMAKKEGNSKMGISIGIAAKETFEACTKARQARFEHGEISKHYATTKRDIPIEEW